MSDACRVRYAEGYAACADEAKSANGIAATVGQRLSAKLTEGEIFNDQIDVLAYSGKVAVDVRIADSHYGEVHTLKFFCAHCVFLFLRWRVVSAAVKFND